MTSVVFSLFAAAAASLGAAGWAGPAGQAEKQPAQEAVKIACAAIDISNDQVQQRERIVRLLQAPQAVPENPALDRKVTVTFQDATLSDVLKWLSSENVNFIAESTQISADRKVTMSVKEQPLRDVIEALADAFNARWSRQGEIYVLKEGRLAYSVPAIAGAPQLLGRLFETMPEGAFRLAPPINEERLEALKGRLGKAMEQFRLEMPPERFLTVPEPGDKGLRLRLEGQEFQELLKGLPELRKHMKLEGPEFQALLKRLPEIRSFMKLEAPEMIERVRGLTRHGIGMENVGELMDSLTKEQWATQEKRGYLTPDDLSEKQRALFGHLPSEGSWSVTVVIGERKLTIKNSGK
ncbi:MAG: DUF4974 domain-containing protein [Armatimonadetes bacterium]|nr:DUF4974 domain-containing protein [Armatimonadota bacterium]